MAGNVTPIRGGGQIAYRLGGDRELDNEQIEYRLGQQNDARQVFWIGDGATAQTLGVSPGQAVTGADVDRVYALMDGVNPETGEVWVKPKVAVAESSKLAAVPAYDAIVWAAAERGVDPESLFATQRDRKDWAGFARQVQAKGDTYRVGVERIEALSSGAGVPVAGAYGKAEWANAVASQGQRVSVGVKGYDVGVTLTKGASIGLVMAPEPVREQLTKIAQKCAQETYQELGERIAYGAAGHHGGGQVARRVDGTGFVGTATMEVTSRAGDPHVHFHSLIANMTMCVDGKARTIGAGGRDVLAHGAWASERFRMKYRAATAEAGLAEWGWNETTKEYDQLNVSADARSVGSKRHAQIVAEKEIFGPDAGKQIDEMAERITRDGKSESVESMDQVAARFGAELTDLGIDIEGDSELVVDDPATWTVGQWVSYLDETLTEHNAVFTRVQVEKEIQRRMPPVADPTAAVTKVADVYLGTSEVLDATQTVMSERLTGGQRYTTQAMLDGEKAVYETTRSGVGQGSHTLSPATAEMALQTYETAEGFTLNEGQRAMFMRWTTGGNQVDLTIGAAGTGKTAAAEAARYAYEAAGRRVLGISTSGLAAQNLGAAAGIEVTTAHGLTKAITEGRAPAVDVLVWDEMGMASTREQAVILPWAAANEIDVRGMGDPKQLDSVGAGSTFETQCDQVGAVELTENMRQTHDHERDAVAQLRTGDVGVAFGTYAEAGQITVSKNPDDRIELMAANWARDAANVDDPHDRLRESVMLSQTNATVSQLHDAARAHARVRGWITGPDVDYRGPAGTRAWACGDALLIRKTLYRTSRDPQQEIFNGQRVIVTNIAPGSREMTVEWKTAGGDLHQRTLNADYVAGNTAPGVALTNHGAQGQSIRHVHADPDGADRNAAYVQTTRSVERLDLYTDLTTLGLSGTDRINVLRMSETDRSRWAADQLAEQVSDRGWQHGETAHEATATDVPMPEKTISVAERPHWKLLDTELTQRAEKLEKRIERYENATEPQALLDEKKAQLARAQNVQDTSNSGVVNLANRHADTIVGNVKDWRAEATSLVEQAERPLSAAHAHQRDVSGKRFGKSSAERTVTAAEEQLRSQFPKSGKPGGHEWQQRAIVEVIEHIHGPDIAQWRNTLSSSDPTVMTHLTNEQKKVNGLLADLPVRGSFTNDWTAHARRPSGYDQHIEPANERWTTPTPDGIRRSAESFAIETEARYKTIDTGLRVAEQRIDTAQRNVDAWPEKAEKATQDLAGITREQSIRENLPTGQRHSETMERYEAKVQENARQQQERSQKVLNDLHNPHHYPTGPDRGHGRSL